MCKTGSSHEPGIIWNSTQDLKLLRGLHVHWNAPIRFNIHSMAIVDIFVRRVPNAVFTNGGYHDSSYNDAIRNICIIYVMNNFWKLDPLHS